MDAPDVEIMAYAAHRYSSPRLLSEIDRLGFNKASSQRRESSGQRGPESHAILFHNRKASGEVLDKPGVTQETLCHADDILRNHSIRQTQYNNPFASIKKRMTL